MLNKIVLTGLLLLAVGCHKKEEVVKTIPQVEVTTPIVQDAQIYRRYVGHIEGTVEVEVQAQVEGELTGFYFTEGQEVKAGDLLFTIDSRPYEAQLSKAEGALAESIANLRYAEDVAKRNARLAQQDYVSKLQYDEYITNVLMSRASIEQTKADIETAKINISYCKIHAPMDGITGILQINVGNLIKNAGATPLTTLNKITPAYAYFAVPQRDLPEIMALHKKEPLTVKVILNGKETYCGKLDLIDNQIDKTTGTIWLRGIFPNEEKELWPGEYVDVRLLLQVEKDALLLPTEAISLGQKGKFVFVVRSDDTVELRIVETGMRFDDQTLVTKGIRPGEKIVTKGQINLNPGTKVKIRETKESS